jgi:hypothetical protein
MPLQRAVRLAAMQIDGDRRDRDVRQRERGEDAAPPGKVSSPRSSKRAPNPPLIVVITTGSAAGLDLQCKAAGVDLLREKRHLQSRLLAFLQRRFPKVWAEGVVTRSLASLHERRV